MVIKKIVKKVPLSTLFHCKGVTMKVHVNLLIFLFCFVVYIVILNNNY